MRDRPGPSTGKGLLGSSEHKLPSGCTPIGAIVGGAPVLLRAEQERGYGILHTVLSNARGHRSQVKKIAGLGAPG